MVRRSRYDVAVMDVRMPGLNGVEALREVRALAPAMNVIMMTAFTRDELVEEAWRATPLAILSKPLDVGRVLSLIEAGARRVPEPPSA
jgi:DNA-binding NarL/FixJ family response regulator